MNMLERVARAIAKAELDNELGGDVVVPEGSSVWVDYVPQAKAAINALMESDESMKRAGLQESLNIMEEYGVDGLSPFSDYPSPLLVTDRCHKAMLREALKE